MTSRFLPRWVLENAARRPDAPAVANPAARLGYGDLATRFEALAGHLAAAGVHAGDRVLVALPNGPATVVASLAVQHLGACAVEVNREWGAETLRAVLEQTGVRQAFVAARDARAWGELARAVQLQRLWVVGPAEPGPELRAALGALAVSWLRDDGRPDPAEPGEAVRVPPLREDQPALVLYTSGSTGQPRGVVQTHANIDANTRSIVEYLALAPADRAMLVLPLYYCYGRSVLQTHLFVGGSVFLDHRFTYPRVVLEAIGTEGCTGFAGIPSMFEVIRRHVDPRTIAMPALRYLTQAGGAMNPVTIRWVREAFSPARLFVMYGQTEATARLSYLPPERALEKEGAIGVPIPGVELRVVDDSGVEVPVGVTGNLTARGGNVTLGYLGAPAETAEILRDGWLWTGDLAYRDADGFFFHAGRAKEILKIAGHRVAPAEIEHVLARHPDVAEVAVVGVKEPLAGEAALAFVVARDGRALSENEVARFCREHMPAWKVPAIQLVPDLPRNEAGKVLRAQLAARHPRVV